MENPFYTQNCIYRIVNDLNLGGNEFTIPNNCCIVFEGGTIRNGTLVGQKTKLLGSPINSNFNMSGEFYHLLIGDFSNLSTSSFVWTEVGRNLFVYNNKKPVWWNGYNWYEADGAKAGVRRCGTFAQKPSSDDIYPGFQYHNIDTHKMITWDGTKWYNPDGTEAAA